MRGGGVGRSNWRGGGGVGRATCGAGRDGAIWRGGSVGWDEGGARNDGRRSDSIEGRGGAEGFGAIEGRVLSLRTGGVRPICRPRSAPMGAAPGPDVPALGTG